MKLINSYGVMELLNDGVRKLEGLKVYIISYELSDEKRRLDYYFITKSKQNEGVTNNPQL